MYKFLMSVRSITIRRLYSTSTRGDLSSQWTSSTNERTHARTSWHPVLQNDSYTILLSTVSLRGRQLRDFMTIFDSQLAMMPWLWIFWKYGFSEIAWLCIFPEYTYLRTAWLCIFQKYPYFGMSWLCISPKYAYFGAYAYLQLNVLVTTSSSTTYTSSTYVSIVDKQGYVVSLYLSGGLLQFYKCSVRTGVLTSNRNENTHYSEYYYEHPLELCRVCKRHTTTYIPVLGAPRLEPSV